MTSDRGVIRQTHSMIWAPRWLTALVVALASSVLMVVTTPARAADGETELGATQLAAKTYPGVQLIQEDFTSTISVPQAIIDEAAVNELYTRLVVQAATGAIGTAESQIIDAFVAELAKDPFHYVTPTDARTTVEVGLSGFGTGFVVNAEGYLVTAAHVIAPDPDELKVEFARAGLRDLIANDLDEVQASGVAYSPANLDTLAQAFQDWYVRYLEVGEVSTTVSAQIGVATAGVDKTQRGQPAEIIKVGAPYPGKDVAVLKLDGAAHLPTLPLGDDADVPEGSTLHVTGYPAASTFSSGMSADSQVQPTITAVPSGPAAAARASATGPRRPDGSARLACPATAAGQPPAAATGDPAAATAAPIGPPTTASLARAGVGSWSAATPRFAAARPLTVLPPAPERFRRPGAGATWCAPRPRRTVER
jgi:serine protease Do